MCYYLTGYPAFSKREIHAARTVCDEAPCHHDRKFLKWFTPLAQAELEAFNKENLGGVIIGQTLDGYS